MQEKELVDRLKNREMYAIEQIIEKYHKYVFKIVYTILSGYVSEIDIQAVVNQVFFKLWENAEKLDLNNYESIKQYLGAIAKNTAIDERKKMRKELPLDEFVIGNVSESISNIELKEIVRKSLIELSYDYKIALLKYYFQGKTIRQIAKEESVPQSTIKTRLNRGRKKLKEILEKGGYVYEN